MGNPALAKYAHKMSEADWAWYEGIEARLRAMDHPGQAQYLNKMLAVYQGKRIKEMSQYPIWRSLHRERLFKMAKAAQKKRDAKRRRAQVARDLLNDIVIVLHEEPIVLIEG